MHIMFLFLLPIDIKIGKRLGDKSKSKIKVCLSMHKTSQMVFQSAFIYLINCGKYSVEILQLTLCNEVQLLMNSSSVISDMHAYLHNAPSIPNYVILAFLHT
jgi:hypothetical protein